MENSADPHCVDCGAWHRFVERRMAMASSRVAPGGRWWDFLWLLALVANRRHRRIVGSICYRPINVGLNPGFHHCGICGSGAPRLEDSNEEPPITLGCLPRLFRICADSMCSYAAPNHPPKVIKPLFPEERSFGSTWGFVSDTKVAAKSDTYPVASLAPARGRPDRADTPNTSQTLRQIAIKATTFRP
jgi:hypothetical protein